MWHRQFSFLTKHKDVRSSNRSILRRSSYNWGLATLKLQSNPGQINCRALIERRSANSPSEIPQARHFNKVCLHKSAPLRMRSHGLLTFIGQNEAGQKPPQIIQFRACSVECLPTTETTENDPLVVQPEPMTDLSTRHQADRN